MRAGMTALVLATGLLSAAVTPVPGTAAHESPAIHGTEEPAVIAALRAKGARVLALGERGGLDGHFVELADGDAYGLYLTPDGHAVAGLLYGPDGTLLTGDQIAAAGGRGADIGTKTVRPVSVAAPNEEAAASGGWQKGAVRLAHAYVDDPAVPGIEAPDTEVYTEVLFERSASAFGFTLGRTVPTVVLFADPGCRWSRSAVPDSAGRRSTGGCGFMWSRSVCSAPPRPATPHRSPPPPIPQWPGSRGWIWRAVRRADEGSRATTACSTLGASARCP